LKKVVNRLRVAANDFSEQPRFIETLLRQGYRFIAEALERHSEVPGPRKVAPDRGVRSEFCLGPLWFWEFPLAVSIHSSRLHRSWLHVIRESSQTGSTRGKLVVGHSIQLGVFRLGFPEDWDVTIGISQVTKTLDNQSLP